MASTEPLPVDEDPALLLDVCARLLAERTLARLHAQGCTGLRESDGFVFQHLVPGPLTITQLAERLDVTQQGASKAVADLERRGFVQRTPSPDDDRARLVALTELGWSAVHGARQARRRFRTELRRMLGPEGEAAVTAALGRLADRLGGFEALRTRRLRPPS